MTIVDRLTTDEIIRNRDVSTALPVTVWFRLQPTRSPITSDEASLVMYHHCEDARMVPGTLTFATCDESARLRSWLHTNLTQLTLCPVHSVEVEFDSVETARRITCPSGHGWRVAGYEGGPRVITPIQE